MKTIRTTQYFTAVPAKRPGFVTIKARAADVTPRQRTVRPRTWAELQTYADDTFDAACSWNLGIAAFLKTTSIIGIDFIGVGGIRHTNVSIIALGTGKSIAIVDLTDLKPARTLAIDRYLRTRSIKGLQRMAITLARRSTPQTFCIL